MVLIILHRRHIRRLRSEDANDKHKSLDFGLDMVPTVDRKTKKRKGEPEMAFTGMEKPKHGRGMSVDIMSDPYLLPPGLHEDGKYRGATPLSPIDDNSMRSFGANNKSRMMDDASSFTVQSPRLPHDDMDHGLLQNAQRVSRCSPPIRENPFSDQATLTSDNGNDIAERSNPRIASPEPALLSGRASDNSEQHSPNTRSSNDYLGSLIQAKPRSPTPTQESYDRLNHGNSKDAELPHAITLPGTAHTSAQPPRISLPFSDDQSDYGDIRRSSHIMPAPQVNVESVESESPQENPRMSFLNQPYDTTGTHLDTRRLTLGVRPLPPEDPSDNPEQRANRIRSFYKEYFDDSKPRQSEFYGEFDPDAYQHMAGDLEIPPVPAPFAQPDGRRAMTPPPRMPPRFQGYNPETASTYGLGPIDGPRAFSSLSGEVGPRAFSSASGRMGPPMPKKPRPPPSPLHVLPTPHKLKDENEILPIDYAPGKSFKDQRAGRPETPLGGVQPYSPNLPSFVPLASAYDDLAAMPSP